MPIRLPEAPHQYSRSDQDMLRRLIEQAVNATPAGGGVAPAPSLPAGALGDTLYYDGANWTNSSFLKNTTTAVVIGADIGGTEQLRVEGSVSVGGASAYAIAGVNALYRSGGWVRLGNDGSSWFTTGKTGDPTNYYDADLHIWRTKDAAAGVAFLDASLGLRPATAGLPFGSAALPWGMTRQNGTHFVALGAITADQQTLTRTLEWNNSGVLFVGDYMNLTPTAYASGSKPFDYRINGTPRFYMQVPTPLGDQSSLGFIQITPPDNQVALNLTANRTSTQGGEGVLNLTAFMNTTSHPSLFYVNAVNAGGYGTSTQLMRAAVDGGTLFGVTATGNVGLAGGPTSDVWVRIGPGGSAATVEEGLQVNTTMTNTGFLSHWVVNVLGGGAAGSAYTTPEVYGIQVGTYAKALNQTITTWYGLDILAGPTAGTKWSIRTAESVWIKGNLVVDGTITGFAGIGSHTHAETDITDGSLLARVAANESITGAWTFVPSSAATAIAVTQAVGAKGIVIAGGTQTTSQPILDLTQTWNAGGAVFQAIKVNVTNTASSNASSLLDLQVDGTVEFKVTKSLGVEVKRTMVIRAGGTASPSPHVGLELAGTLTGSTDQYYIRASQMDFDAGSTGTGTGLDLQVRTVSGSFTMTASRALHIGTPVLGGGGAAITTNYGIYIQNQTGASTNYAIFTNTGTVRFGDVVNTTESYQVDGTKVVGNRVTGYTAMTGTADRGTSYATGSITLVQLAERVKALQDDLTTHGLIGA